MSTIVKFVPAEEREIAMGVVGTSPAHWVVVAGDYADQGEADIDIRIIGACDSEGNDISEAIASTVAKVIEESTAADAAEKSN